MRRAALGCIAIAGALTVVLGLVPAPADAAGPYQFHAITPCRVFDTRNPNGPAGGPALNCTTRNFQVQGTCGVPVGANAVALNATITQPTGFGHLTLYPSGGVLPGVSTLNFVPNEPALANGAIVPVSTQTLDLGTRVFVTPDGLNCSGSVHLIVDVTGYFDD
jgi:hypothetical protein